MPKGPPFHPSKEEKLAQRIHFLERTIAQLHFKVLLLHTAKDIIRGDCYCLSQPTITITMHFAKGAQFCLPYLAAT